jgi:DNA-binding transcriptional ArsR family regulator
MSLSESSRRTANAADGATNTAVTPALVIDLLSDDCAREFLQALRDEPRAARELAEECGVSRPTAYRRLNRLQEAGLVTDRIDVSDDGHHRRTFGATVDGVGLELGDDGLEATVTTTESPAAPRS